MDPVVVVDIGHGGHDPGTCHNGIIEATYVLAIGQVLKGALSDAGIRCELTRDATRDPSFSERARFAVDHMAAGVICLHVNAGATQEHGPLAFHRDDDVLGMQAAQTFIRTLSRGGEYVDDERLRPMRWQTHVIRPVGWKSRAWNVLIQQPIPCFLAELEYCTHKPSADWLLSIEGQDQIVAALTEAAMVMCK